MKQRNNSSNNLVTKPFFKKELKREFGVFEERFEKRMEKKFVTKDYFKKELKKELKKFATKEDLSSLEMRVALKFDNFAGRIDENAQKYRDQILNSNDKLVKELQEMREENTIGSHQIRELNGQVDDHEKRIGKLEHAQQAA